MHAWGSILWTPHAQPHFIRRQLLHTNLLRLLLVVIHVNDCMNQFKMPVIFLYTSEIVFAAGGSMDWIASGSEHGHTSWIGLDWVSEFVDWVGLDLA